MVTNGDFGESEELGVALLDEGVAEISPTGTQSAPTEEAADNAAAAAAGEGSKLSCQNKDIIIAFGLGEVESSLRKKFADCAGYQEWQSQIVLQFTCDFTISRKGPRSSVLRAEKASNDFIRRACSRLWKFTSTGPAASCSTHKVPFGGAKYYCDRRLR